MFFIKSGLNEELVTPPVKPRKNEHHTRKACTNEHHTRKACTF